MRDFGIEKSVWEGQCQRRDDRGRVHPNSALRQSQQREYGSDDEKEKWNFLRSERGKTGSLWEAIALR